MRLLLDTSALLWWQSDDQRIKPVVPVIEAADQVLISTASLLEITVKIGIGKLRLRLPDLLAAIRADRFEILPIEPHHLLRQVEMPFHHRDPFDRVVLAQAMAESARVVTADRKFELYDVDIVWTER